MAANAQDAPPVLLRSLPRNGCEPAPRPAMERWYCEGWNEARQRPCRAMLMEVALGPGSRVRIKCRDCNGWSIREGVAAPRTGGQCGEDE